MRNGERPLMIKKSVHAFVCFVTIVFILSLLCSPSIAQTLPSETPEKFTPTNDGFEYVPREVMIPTRDGLKLHTVIVVPKGAKNAPILLTRQPYNPTKLTRHPPSSHVPPIPHGYDNYTEAS